MKVNEKLTVVCEMNLITVMARKFREQNTFISDEEYSQLVC
jgi:hypothetical protein